MQMLARAGAAGGVVVEADSVRGRISIWSMRVLRRGLGKGEKGCFQSATGSVETDRRVLSATVIHAHIHTSNTRAHARRTGPPTSK
jgi:hypothetical protein